MFHVACCIFVVSLWVWGPLWQWHFLCCLPDNSSCNREQRQQQQHQQQQQKHSHQQQQIKSNIRRLVGAFYFVVLCSQPAKKTVRQTESQLAWLVGNALALTLTLTLFAAPDCRP